MSVRYDFMTFWQISNCNLHRKYLSHWQMDRHNWLEIVSLLFIAEQYTVSVNNVSIFQWGIFRPRIICIKYFGDVFSEIMLKGNLKRKRFIQNFDDASGLNLILFNKSIRAMHSLQSKWCFTSSNNVYTCCQLNKM